MKPKRPTKSKALQPAAPPAFDGLLRELRDFITESRRQVLRAVDVVQVRTCWGVGRHIIEFEQGGAVRAEYGAKLLPRLAVKLTEEFGRGFDARNLRHMRAFYSAYPIWNAVRTKLSWTHYRTLLGIEDEHAREWYENEAVAQNWSSRALERQVSRLYYERLLSSKDRKAVRAEAEEKIAELPPSPRDFVRDPLFLEFLGLPETGRLLESGLEQRTSNKPAPKHGQELRQFRSTDDGATWRDEGLIADWHNHPPHLLRLEDGRILLTYGNRRDGGIKTRLTADEGKTWSAPQRIFTTSPGDMGYPSTTQLPDGKLVTVFYAIKSPLHDGYHMGAVGWSAP